MAASTDMRRLLGLARPELPTLALATVALLISSSLALVGPQGIRVLLDAVTKPDGRVTMNHAVVGLLALFAVASVFTFVRAYLFTLAGERVVANLRKRLFGNVLAQEVGFFDSQRTGELLNRLSADTSVLQNSVTVNISMALRFVVQAIGSICILIWTSWHLSVLMLATVPFVTIGAVFFARTVRRLSRRTQDALAEAASVAEEAMANVRTVRSFAREPEELGRYSRKIDISFELGRTLAKAYGLFQGLTGFAAYVAITLVLWYGGTLVMAGRLSVGELTAFMLYTLFLAFAMGGMSGLYGDFNRAIGASGRVFELLDRTSVIANQGGDKLEKVHGEMRLEHVDFAYPSRTETIVLKDVSLDLSPGRVLALVGPSGSGKSTVGSLLARFYDPRNGRVTFDGVDVRQLDAAWLREQIGAVAQEPVLFAGTIADNIRYGRPHAELDQIMAAATAANADDFIRQFPQGYSTLVGERGVRLSGGQKQRIAIARALLKDPRVLILDEATSALDSESEHLVQVALERLMRGRTVLVIAHRLSTVKDADQVVVLEHGRIVESGRHQELVEQNGVYRRLVERQFAVG